MFLLQFRVETIHRKGKENRYKTPNNREPFIMSTFRPLAISVCLFLGVLPLFPLVSSASFYSTFKDKVLTQTSSSCSSWIDSSPPFCCLQSTQSKTTTEPKKVLGKCKEPGNNPALLIRVCVHFGITCEVSTLLTGCSTGKALNLLVSSTCEF